MSTKPDKTWDTIALMVGNVAIAPLIIAAIWTDQAWPKHIITWLIVVRALATIVVMAIYIAELGKQDRKDRDRMDRIRKHLDSMESQGIQNKTKEKA